MEHPVLVRGFLVLLVSAPAWAVVCPPPGKATPQECAQTKKSIDYAKSELRTARQYASSSGAHRDAIPGWEKLIRDGEALMAACGCGNTLGNPGNTPPTGASRPYTPPAANIDQSSCMSRGRPVNTGNPGSYTEWRNTCSQTVWVGMCTPDAGCSSTTISGNGTLILNDGATSMAFCSKDPEVSGQTVRCGGAQTGPGSAPSASSGGVSSRPSASIVDDEPQFGDRQKKQEVASQCLKVVPARGPGYTRGFKNSCSHPVQYTFCVVDEKSLFNCKVRPPRGEGAGSVGPGKTAAIPDWHAGSEIFYVGCKGGLGETLPLMNQNGGKTGCY